MVLKIKLRMVGVGDIAKKGEGPHSSEWRTFIKIGGDLLSHLDRQYHRRWGA